MIRRTLLLLVAMLLFGTFEASAQCKECYVDPQTDCASCVDTNYNASVLCDIVQNGYGCAMSGECTGTDGECRVQYRTAELRPPQQHHEWQLVSVEITHVKESKRRS